MRRHALEEVRRFEEQARQSGIQNDMVMAARYALCAGLDEAVLSTPWGGQSEWAQNPLLVALHHEAWGGEKFFDMLDRVSREPAKYIDLMELQYLCLAFGFAGKYQVKERGHEQLADVQQALYRRIRNQRTPPDPELSLRWRGLEDRRNPVIRYVPWWVVAAAALAIAAVTFTVYYTRLARTAEPIQVRLANVGREGFAQPVAPPPAKGPTLKQLLAADERAGVLRVDEQGGRTVVTMLAAGLFASGSATVNTGHRRHAGARRRRRRAGAGPRPGRRPHRRPAGAIAALPGQLRAVPGTGGQRRPGAAQGAGQCRAGELDRCRLVRAAGPPRIIAREPRAQPPRGDRPRARHASMFALLKRLIVVIIGFLLMALFIWFAGPLFAFGSYRPLETETSRFIAMGVVVAVWAGVRLVRRLRAFRASDMLVAAVLKQAHPVKDQPSAEVVRLRERFEEAVATLKQSRHGGHSLYDLPWYVIIGAPGSGKTTALLNSGLKFPLEQRVGKGALRGVGGTRNCDWWFTEEAVLLDTAGRYTTQDSDAASDSEGWAEFLALLAQVPEAPAAERRHPDHQRLRPRWSQGESEREAHIEAARRRLERAQSRAGHPAAGLRDGDQVRPGRRLRRILRRPDPGAARAGLGRHLPLRADRQRRGDRARFPAEFEALMARLNERVFARVEEDRDVRRRTAVFGFPQQMAALKDLLAEFVNEVFATSRLDRPVLLRGVYLTSGTQEGTPIDRLLGAIGRRFGVAADAGGAVDRPRQGLLRRAPAADVMIGESGLAGMNRKLEVRKAAAQLGAYTALAVVTVLAFAVLVVEREPQSRLPAATSRPRSRRSTRCRRWRRMPRCDAAAAPRRGAHRRRGGRPAPRGHAVGHAVGPVPGHGARQCGPRRLPARARRRAAAAGGAAASGNACSRTAPSPRRSTNISRPT